MIILASIGITLEVVFLMSNLYIISVDFNQQEDISVATRMHLNWPASKTYLLNARFKKMESGTEVFHHSTMRHRNRGEPMHRTH